MRTTVTTIKATFRREVEAGADGVGQVTGGGIAFPQRGQNLLPTVTGVKQFGHAIC